MAVDINTAVDSLVKLVQRKGTISVEDAAKELSIPSPIVNEWAVFLEEEGIVGIEYKFATPYITYKRKEQVYQTEKDLIKKKLNLLLLSVEGKVPKTKKGMMQKDFLASSIQSLIKEADLLNPLTKDRLVEEIRKTIKRKILFEKELASGN
jgi:predicted ArsR family transcriptional regulator